MKYEAKKTKKRRLETKQEMSKKENLGILWREKLPMPKMTQVLRFAIPYDTNLSKNRMLGIKKGKRFYFRNPQTKAIQEMIAWEIKGSRTKWYADKLYVSIFVQKPYFGTAAINFVDTICDAIQVGTGINDCWIVLRRVDWQVIKINPKIFIEISQSGTEDKKPCSTCGRILTLNHFSGIKTKSGECKKCKSVCRNVKN